MSEEKISNLTMLYDELLERTEGRSASYGELAYIQGLSKKEQEKLEKDDYLYFYYNSSW